MTLDYAESRLAPQDKIVLHEQFALYMQGEHIYPVNIEISPYGACNASCAFCWYANTGELGEHRNVSLRLSALSDVLDEAFNLGVKGITWTGGGEPTLYKDFDKITAYAVGCCLDQGLFTNALAMPRYQPELFEWIRVTMTDRPYKPECIRPLRMATTLSFAFNYAGPQDDAYLMDTCHLADEVGADYVQVRPALAFHGETVDIVPPGFFHPLLYITEYKFTEARKPHGYARCEGFHFVPFLWEDGNLDVCAYMRKHQGYRLGNIYEESLKTILDRAPAYVDVHRHCQVGCKLHEINMKIDASRKLEDRNFP